MHFQDYAGSLHYLWIEDKYRPSAMHQKAKDSCNLLKFVPLNCPCIIRERNERHHEEEKILKLTFDGNRMQRNCIIHLVFWKSIKGTNRENHKEK